MPARPPLRLTPELEKIRDKARRAISPILPATDRTAAHPKFLFTAQRTQAGQHLPAYFLVYFLLVDLLGFRNLGQFEKVSWSIPIDFEGKAFLIEHRKFGVGVFAQDAALENARAERIVALIGHGVEIARPFFGWLAEEAVRGSRINLINNSQWLYERYVFLRERFRDAAASAVAKKDAVEENGKGSIHIPWFELRNNASWLGISAIDAFFSWTEHIFIHIAILRGRATNGLEVARLIEADWATKFKAALDVADPMMHALYQKLLEIRRQHRNFVAHGAFGKRGEAFNFHSGAGAVPVALSRRPRGRRFSLSYQREIAEEAAIATIEDFVALLWDGDRQPAKVYLQDAELPLVLTYARDGTYKAAMRSVEDMEMFASELVNQMDRAANMDW